MSKLAEILPGSSLVGAVFESSGQEPAAYGALLNDEAYGPVLKIAYFDDIFEEASSGVAAWSEGIGVPNNLLFISTQGAATFHECVVIKKVSNFNGISELTLRPTAVVFGRDAAEMQGALRVRRLESRLPRLRSWLRTDPVTVTHHHDECNRVQQSTLRTVETEEHALSFGEIDLRLGTTWTARQGSTYKGFTTQGYIVTTSEEPVMLQQHLGFHQRVRSLMILSSGRPSAFTQHSARVEADGPSSRLIHFSTYGEPEDGDLTNSWTNDHICGWDHADAAKLRSWLSGEQALYDASLPAVELLHRPKFSAKDRVIYMGIVAESLGKSLPAVDGESGTYTRGRTTHATNVMRCIVHSELDVSRWMSSVADWARGISKYYNKTKHFQPDLTPDPSVAGILGRFMAITIRHVAVRQALVGPESVSQKLIVDAESMRALEGLEYIKLGEDCWPTYQVLTEQTDEHDAGESNEES